MGKTKALTEDDLLRRVAPKARACHIASTLNQSLVSATMHYVCFKCFIPSQPWLFSININDFVRFNRSEHTCRGRRLTAQGRLICDLETGCYVTWRLAVMCLGDWLICDLGAG